MQTLAVEKSSFTHGPDGKPLAYTAAQFNLQFMIRYYEDSNRLSKHKLIGFTTLVELVGARSINQVLERAMNSEEQMPQLKLRRGCMFRFFRR